MRNFSVTTSIAARVLIDEAPTAEPAGFIMAFHGYAEAPEQVLEGVRAIPGIEDWTVVAPMALHRFYRRGGSRSDQVVGSWMTREDRDLAIRDNLSYANRVIESVEIARAKPVIFLGFSQGASMAYRAALLGSRRAAGIVALGGDIPPELRALAGRGDWPEVLIGAGDHDQWYTAAKLEVDEAALSECGVVPYVVRYAGGHAWTREFCEAAGRWIGERTADANRSTPAG
jgi:predicted esterase